MKPIKKVWGYTYWTLSADAPWCVHCHRLTPVWHQLADVYADSNDVIVAQIDVTANDVTGVEINAFPTIKLYGKDGRTVAYCTILAAAAAAVVEVLVWSVLENTYFAFFFFKIQKTWLFAFFLLCCIRFLEQWPSVSSPLRSLSNRQLTLCALKQQTITYTYII